MTRLFCLFKGYLRCEVSGYAMERFMNLCNHKGIHLWNVEQNSSSCMMNISIEDFRRIKPILKKTGTRIKIIEKKGLPFFMFRNRKRKWLFIGLFMFAVLIKVLTLFIWDIEIEGNMYYTDDMVTKYLSTLDVSPGTLKKTIDVSGLEEELRIKYNNISWVSIQIDGTKLMIRMTEIPQQEAKTANTFESNHIVADQYAIITSIVTRKGIPLVKAGDYVAKGDILIQGNLPVYNDDGTLKNMEYVQADGDIMGEVVYNYNKTYNLEHQVKSYTGKTYNTYSLNFGNQTWNIRWFAKDYSNEAVETTLNKYPITNNLYLPFSYSKSVHKEFVVKTEKYTESEMKAVAQKELQQFLDDLEEKGVQIMENSVKIHIGQNYCYATGEVKVIQALGVIQECIPEETIPDESESEQEN